MIKERARASLQGQEKEDSEAGSTLSMSDSDGHDVDTESATVALTERWKFNPRCQGGPKDWNKVDDSPRGTLADRWSKKLSSKFPRRASSVSIEPMLKFLEERNVADKLDVKRMIPTEDGWFVLPHKAYKSRQRTRAVTGSRLGTARSLRRSTACFSQTEQ